MPDLSGIDAMKRIHEHDPDLPVVILTAHADPGCRGGGASGGRIGVPGEGNTPRDIVIVLHEAADELR